VSCGACSACADCYYGDHHGQAATDGACQCCGATVYGFPAWVPADETDRDSHDA
jgi:hypothetical protein